MTFPFWQVADPDADDSGAADAVADDDHNNHHGEDSSVFRMIGRG